MLIAQRGSCQQSQDLLQVPHKVGGRTSPACSFPMSPAASCSNALEAVQVHPQATLSLPQQSQERRGCPSPGPGPTARSRSAVSSENEEPPEPPECPTRCWPGRRPFLRGTSSLLGSRGGPDEAADDETAGVSGDGSFRCSLPRGAVSRPKDQALAFSDPLGPRPAGIMPSTGWVTCCAPSLCPGCPVRLLGPGGLRSPSQRQLRMALRMGT